MCRAFVTADVLVKVLSHGAIAMGFYTSSAPSMKVKAYVYLYYKLEGIETDPDTFMIRLRDSVNRRALGLCKAPSSLRLHGLLIFIELIRLFQAGLRPIVISPTLGPRLI